MVERLEFPYKTWIMKNDYLMFIGSYITVVFFTSTCGSR